MSAYFDIKVRPMEDTAPSVVLSSVFSALHLMLVERKSSDIGISFPDSSNSIGTAMRVHGSIDSLKQIVLPLLRFSDYCAISSPSETPPTSEWRLVNRVQAPMTSAKIRRLVRRGSITEQEAEIRLSQPKLLSNPYLRIKSHSTGQLFRIFFSQTPVSPPNGSQIFNTYGMGGVVPWFDK